MSITIDPFMISLLVTLFAFASRDEKGHHEAFMNHDPEASKHLELPARLVEVTMLRAAWAEALGRKQMVGALLVVELIMIPVSAVCKSLWAML